MKRRGSLRTLVVFFSLVLCLQLGLSYEYDASNLSLNVNQIYGEPISGSFVLSLLDAPSNLIFSSDFGRITLQQILVNEGKTLGCEDYNCSGIYSTVDSGFSSRNFNVDSSGISYGILFSGEDVVSDGFGIKLTSQFDESDVVPLSIRVGNSYLWSYNTPSEDLMSYRQLTYGCFNPSTSLTNAEINSLGYCEEVNLTDSSSYYLGANMSGFGSADFIFSLLKDGVEIGNCLSHISSASFSTPSGCFVPLTEKQSAGKFEVCVKASEDITSIYSLKKESSGTNCGRYSGGARVADYSLFVTVPFYAASDGEISLGESFMASSTDAINYYISEVYGNDCSSGCIVPISFYGNNISLSVSNISSRYSSLSGVETITKLYSLLEDVYRISFSDAVSLSSFNWIVNKYGNVTFDIYLEGDDAFNNLFSTSFFVQPMSYAKGVYPMNPPAGVDVYFYADIEGNFTKLVWNFGDGSVSTETSQLFVKHKYLNVSDNYNISIGVFNGNLSVSKVFFVNTSSPESYIDETLVLKRNKFNSLGSDIDNLPSITKDFVKEKLQFNSIQLELTQLEIEKTQALSTSDFLNLAGKTSSLHIPSISSYETRTGSLEFSYSDVNPSFVTEIISGDYDSLEEYVSPIYAWQIRNINSTMTKKKIRAIKENGERQEILTLYDVILKSRSTDESYFIIQLPRASIYFSSNVNAVEIQGATYIKISPETEYSFSFFAEGASDLVMFVSPSLDTLRLNQEISVCIVNGACQKDVGENADNCPQDCKSYFSGIVVIFGIIIFMLVIYTILQIWYVKRYEQFLFKDRAFVFNLLAFVNNSKLNGMSKDRIVSALVAKGWSREQIDYVIKKSEGKNTGMFEILPIQKIVAYYAMNDAKKNIEFKTTPPVNSFNGARIITGKNNNLRKI